MTSDEAKAAGLICVGGEWYSPNHRAVVGARSVGAAAKLERNPGDGALGKGQVQTKDTGHFFIRLTSVRRRLLDEDNLCEKYLVDCCRYAGLIPGDGPGQTKIEVCQQKAEPGGEEFTRIEIFKV
jgi:hypothetical protein